MQAITIVELSKYEYLCQVYFSPVNVDPRYPGVNAAEWRACQQISTDGTVSYTTAVKFGDKKSGSRVELEASLQSGVFGTEQADICDYGYGVVQTAIPTFLTHQEPANFDYVVR